MKTMSDYKHEVRRPTDYNNGQIHGWNGGDCPVHPETVVRYWLRSGRTFDENTAHALRWCHNESAGDIVAFQVVKAYVEPKVIWVNEANLLEDWSVYATEEAAVDVARPWNTRIVVKYVEARDE
jgi:hypothetical protein